MLFLYEHKYIGDFQICMSVPLRIGRLCSEENDFKNYRSQMKSWFLKRGYPEKLIENEMRKVKFGKEGIKRAKGVKGIPPPIKKSRENNKSKHLFIKYE